MSRPANRSTGLHHAMRGASRRNARWTAGALPGRVILMAWLAAASARGQAMGPASPIPRSRVTVALDSGRVTVGDPVAVRVVAHLAPGARLIDGVPHAHEPLPDGMRLLAARSLHPAADGVQSGELTIAVFRPGPTRIPPFAVTYRVSKDAPVDTLVGNELPLTVTPVVPMGAGTLRDFKDIEGATVSLAAAARLAAGILVLLAAAVFAAFRLRRKRARASVALRDAVPASAPPGPYATALAQLTTIADADWMAQGELVAHYALVVDVLRRYLQEGHGVAALARTTPELLLALPSPLATPPLDTAARVLLDRADLVKFARLRPRPPSATIFLASARALLTDWELVAPTNGHHQAPATAFGAGSPVSRPLGRRQDADAIR
jgi:hypothetical protein